MPDKLYFQSEDNSYEFSFARSLLAKLQAWVYKNRWAVASGIIGLGFLIFGGASLASNLFQGEKVEVLGNSTSSSLSTSTEGSKITVEIAGEVQKPGVFELKNSDRVEQLLILSGGLGPNADREWVEKNLNRAAKLVDGQKIYIPSKNDTTVKNLASKGLAFQGYEADTNSGQKNMISINNSSLKELDTLPGIGATRAQAIIDHRPYNTIDELVSKKAITKSIFDKIKDSISI